MKRSELSQTEYFQYYKPYVNLVDDIPLIEALERGLLNTKEFFESIAQEKQLYQYDQGKWTPKEILLHLIDTERVFCYRALYFARAEDSNVEGFDENTFGANCEANSRTLDDLLKEFFTVRTASVCLFESFSEVVLKRGGMANNNVLSVRAAGFIICGHEIHHKKVIQERYL
ncbi:MAG: hypothetical protein ACI9RM_002092 [Ulvibacter sp.]|jgi:hypothetical protein